jgi:hypothetical protein
MVVSSMSPRMSRMRSTLHPCLLGAPHVNIPSPTRQQLVHVVAIVDRYAVVRGAYLVQQFDDVLDRWVVIRWYLLE